MQKFEGAKYDDGKLRYSTIPPEVLDAIAAVRDYGYKKYGEAENWRSIKPERWHEALLRHVRAMWDDPLHIDEESGLPSLWHVATNVAFLCACFDGMQREEISREEITLAMNDVFTTPRGVMP